MKVLTSLQGLPEELHGAVLVLGNFDAVHSGHQAMIEEARRLSERLGKPLAAMTFEPHPRRLFRPDDPPFRIIPPLLKRQRLELAGVEWLLELQFDWAFASQGPSAFMDKCLRRGVRPSHIVVGDDFRFGQHREGSPQALRAAGYEVTVYDRFLDADGTVVSCTAIRQALQEGDIDRANRLLGWQWEIVGAVRRGDQRGRELGYPTANIPLGDVLHPAYGVYAARVCITGDGDEPQWLPSVTNIGIRPMFKIPVAQSESFIFDLDRDVYDRVLRVRPVRRLRGEATFGSLDQLVAQMGRDSEQARAVLGA